ncbi:probable tRNA N6-adenosine threonylcarbamoyltransferase, mitochondrial isoform X1 [Centruroides sculpturatus]|uniref:probable tRNA N6-adenosine threonylcarbamoyltransferase, mitochondrial isoform X1 n=2 Tax=Centruroides sculpturatus TaxID=218467 RepID=UPI000C6D4A9B|nr:probable tRNA N6-adenosine threonylcarbamoyltransferase, mitochondrial isoform X1 [Centruroides sculpturatus]
MLIPVNRIFISGCGRGFNYSFRCFERKYRTVLGIETSCDDTGAAIVDEFGNIISDVLRSQQQFHLDNGGVIPRLAKSLHQDQIEYVITNTLKKSGMSLQDISAIATTVKPGLLHSLLVGFNYSKILVNESEKPFIPIHHMEAHALVVRMTELIQFPFLVLLASGGHCQIAVVKEVDKFLLLGKNLDNPPGEALDKIARRLKLKNLPECSSMCGGRAIEYLSESGNPNAYNFTLPLYKFRSCDFSFSGLKVQALRAIIKEEEENNVFADGLIPNISDFCASILHAFTKHLVRQVQRAMIFCEKKNLIPEDKRTLVFSGGVACNAYIRAALNKLCGHSGWQFSCPPPKLCNDNGIMIAWNGMERLKAGIGITKSIDEVNVISKCPLGKDISKEVIDENIKIKRFQFGEVNDTVNKSNMRI